MKNLEERQREKLGFQITFSNVTFTPFSVICQEGYCAWLEYFFENIVRISKYSYGSNVCQRHGLGLSELGTSLCP